MGGPRTILLTGFEPFGNWSRNVTREAVAALDGERRHGFTLRAAELPVAYPRALKVLERAVKLARPVAVVAFGIHRSPELAVRVETVAANELKFRIPDNDGKKRRGAIEKGAPRALRIGLPPRELEAAIRARGIPVRCSRDAGRYLCNAVYYWCLRNVPLSAFVHVPPREDDHPLDDTVAVVDASATAVARALSRQLALVR
jgi:pyroglutamyl-peptidase